MSPISKIHLAKHATDVIVVTPVGEKFIAELRYSSGLRWAWAFGGTADAALAALADSL